MKVNISVTINMEAAIKLDNIKNKSKYIEKLILNDISQSESVDIPAKEEEPSSDV